MNRIDFIEMIRETSPFSRQKIVEVAELLEIFPWFQSAHLLLLKGLHDTADVKFENQLRKSAIHIADREVLYYLLKKPVVPETDSAILEQEYKEIPSETGNKAPDVEKKTDPISADQISEPHSDSFESEQTVIESAKSSDDFIEQVNILEGYSSNSHVIVSAESEYDESGSVLIITEDEKGPVEERVFYMDPGFSMSDHTDLLELELDYDDFPEDLTDLIMPDNTFDGKDEKKIQEELIDIFIASNPRIEPNKEKAFQPVEDISKPFVTEQEQGGFVTETLAKIYINQEYYSKAIDIYEKLSLKFPEKRSYFATQIEKVKALIKK